MTIRSSSSELKPWWSSTFDTVGVKMIAENVDLYPLRLRYPKRVVYQNGRYLVKSRFDTVAWLRSDRGRGVIFIAASILAKFVAQTARTPFAEVEDVQPPCSLPLERLSFTQQVCPTVGQSECGRQQD